MTLNKDVANDIIVGKNTISIETEILKESKFTKKEIRESFLELESMFKDIFPKIFPMNKKGSKIININDTETLNSLIMLSKILSRLKDSQSVRGFKEHIKEYNDKNKFRHNYFVTLLAGFLLSKVDSLELEPVSRDNRHSDIKIKSKDIEIYIEHESVNIDKFLVNNLEAHHYFATLLIKYLKEIPYGIDITYKNPFSPDEIEKLCKRINDLLPSVVSEGTIIDNDNFKVHVTRCSEECKEHPSNITYLQESGSYVFCSTMAPYSRQRVVIKEAIGDKELYNKCRYSKMYDIAENYIYSMHQFFLGKGYINISGPKDVDFKSVLEKKIEYARAQSPIDKPYILALNMEGELGSIEKNRKRLNTIFQPHQNTRYNGILLVKNYDFDFEFIQNPYVKLNLIPFFSGSE